MKIILKQDVTNLGGAGDIVEVADGYGNNFLMPRGLAMRATKGALADAEAISRSREKRMALTRAEANEQKAALEAGPVQVKAKAGEDGTLYGSVGSTAVAEAVRTQLGIALDRRRISLDRPLKETGEHEVPVRLGGGTIATVRVQVVGIEA